MGLDLPSGGHLTHGYQTDKKKISASSIYFQFMPYQVNPTTGLIEYDRLEENAKLFRPNLIISGGSRDPRDLHYARMRKIADNHGAYLLCDMAHISGLIASGEQNNPFEYCDIVTTTTHKTLRGPRAGLIFFRKYTSEELSKNNKPNLEPLINQAVFPSCQGGPHNKTIAAIAVALKQVSSPDFIQYSKQVKSNAVALANKLISLGYSLATSGTDNHLVLWDLKPQGLTGSKVEKLADLVNITLNKNAIVGDKSAMTPGGIRLGTPALTSRGFKENDFEKIAEFLHELILIAKEIQGNSNSNLLKDFIVAAQSYPSLSEFKDRVEKFAQSFTMPGFDVNELKAYFENQNNV